MKTEFFTKESPRASKVKTHIQKIYRDAYGASISEFAPLLVAASNRDGEILCASGIRTAADGFFSETYLDGDLSSALLAHTGLAIDPSEIVEAVSLASATPFPVLSMLDAMISWGRAQGKTCGVFTATKKLRRLLDRAGLTYTALCPASPTRIANQDDWGSYYETDPWVCAFSEATCAPVTLSPRRRTLDTKLVSGGGS